MKRKIILIIVSCLLISCDNCKYVVKKVSLQEYEFADSNLLILMDSILDNESKCPYFTDSLCLSLKIVEYPSTINTFQLIFESPNKGSYYFLEKNPLGFLKIKDHTLYVHDIIPKELFSTKNRTQLFSFIEYKKKLIEINCEDYCYSLWRYKYEGHKIELREFHLPCEEKHYNAFDNEE